MYLSQGLFQKGNLLKVSQESRLEFLSLIRSHQYAILGRCGSIYCIKTLKGKILADKGRQCIISRLTDLLATLCYGIYNVSD